MKRSQIRRGSLLVSALCVLWAAAAAQNVNVVTWQNDTHRTGNYSRESTLSYTNLGVKTFGRLCTAQLDGQVYAQPLILTNVTFTGYTQPQIVAYVTTQNDTVYAISAASTNTAPLCKVLGSISLSHYLSNGTANYYPVDCKYIGAAQCMTIAPVVGILGTPLIDSGKLYVVAEFQDQQDGTQPNNWYHYLFNIDTSSLSVTSDVQIVPPSACPFGGTTSFSQQHIQRPGLLFATVSSTSYIYVAFSMMDGNAPLPNGMVLGYNAANFAASPLCFSTTPGPAVGAPNNAGGGGIWQDGAGLAYGSDGTASYIYFNTGNGVFDGSSNFGDSFVKLNAGTLAEVDYFTPSDQYYRNCLITKNNNVDLDFGSGGVLLVPDQKLSQAPYIAISGDKEGDLWVMNRAAPGEWNAGSCSTSGSCVACTAANNQFPDNENIQTLQVMTNSKDAVFHDTPAFAQFNVNGTTLTNYIYIAAIGGFLTQYQLCNSATAPLCGTPLAESPVGFKNGATPAVSSNSTSGPAEDGILWAIWGDGSYEPNSGGTPPAKIGVLYAYDAVTMQPLYNSSVCSKDNINVATKFSVPTIANGYVYLGTMGPLCSGSCNYNAGAFYIFGSLSRNSC
jgi:hypothetical protein